jgi:hypothetical protein
MSLSVRFGIVLIGLGILFLGFYLQKKSIQGFQNDSGPPVITDSPPPPPPQPITPASLAQPPTTVVDKPLFNVDDVDVLVMKDKQTRSKMNMILNNKNIADVIFLKYIAADLLVNLNVIFNEVFTYIKLVQNVGNLYSNATEMNKNTIRQIIYTASDQVDMLYNIYYTIPSNIVSTDSILVSDSAPPNAVNNPYVIAEASKQISAILATLPSPANKLNTYLNTLMKSISTLSVTSVPGDIITFSLNLAQYLSTIDTQHKNLTKTLETLNTRSIKTPIDNDKLETAKKAKTSFLNTTITSLQSIETSLQATKMTDPKVADAITDLKNRITSLQAALTAMKPPPVLEQFASYMNPYDQPSVSTLQSREFGLGRKTYIDQVFSGIKFW